MHDEVNDQADEEIDDMDSFWRVFKARCDVVEKTLEDIDKENCASNMREVKQMLVNLQILATDNTRILPPYDIKRAQKEISGLGQSARSVDELHNPHKKFTFKSRRRGQAGTNGTQSSSANDPDALAQDVAPSEPSISMVIPGSLELSNLQGGVRVLGATDLPSADDPDLHCSLLMRDCTDLTLSAPCMFGSARFERLRGCTLLLGPCTTSVYMEGCEDCSFLVCCHQLRIHTCVAVKVL
jgi:hypothetical protein